MNPRTPTRQAPEVWKPTVSILSLNGESLKDVLEGFYSFLVADLRFKPYTAKCHCWVIGFFLRTVGKRADEVVKADVRNFLLMEMEGKSESTINNYLKALKRFYRDYLGKPEVVDSFKIKRPAYKAKRVLSKDELKRFYDCLPSLKHKAVFLFYASSGLRAREIASLTWRNVDLTNRRVYSFKESSKTKKVGLGFFNVEALKVLEELAKHKKSMDEQVFPCYRMVELVWRETSKKCGVKVTPQKLREWFCSEMARLGVGDSYIDAFCGRVPRSILARHYLDYSPEKLKEIYDKADLKVLT